MRRSQQKTMHGVRWLPSSTATMSNEGIAWNDPRLPKCGKPAVVSVTTTYVNADQRKLLRRVPPAFRAASGTAALQSLAEVVGPRRSADHADAAVDSALSR